MDSNFLHLKDIFNPGEGHSLTMNVTLCKECSFQTASSGIVWNGPIKDLGGSRKDCHLSLM